MNNYSIHELEIGQQASIAKTISEYDIYSYAGITGDFNPAHVNAQYSSETPFKERIAHGMLSVGLISACIAMQLPGPGTIYLSQEITFTAPVRIGDTITAVVAVVAKDTEKNRITLSTVCTNQEGKIVIKGEATVKPPIKSPNKSTLCEVASQP